MRRPCTTISCRFLTRHHISLAAACLLLLGLSTPASAAPKRTLDDFIFPLWTLWTTQLPSTPAAWPAYDEERCYVPMRSGELIALSQEDGTPLWWLPLTTTLPPAAGDGVVYVAVGERVVAVDGSSGLIRWDTRVGAPLSAPLLWDSGWLVASLSTGEVAVLRGDNGQVLWRRNLEAPPAIRPSIAADALYVPAGDRVVALSLTSGDLLWERRLGDRVSRILPLEERLYVGSFDNFFYTLSVRDGRIRWRWRTGGDVVGAPAVDLSRVYFTSMDNLLRALDRNHGAQRWRAPVPLRPLWGPDVLGKVVLVSGLGPQVRGYWTDTGEPAGLYLASSELAAPLHIVGGATSEAHRLFLITGNGVVEAVRHTIEPPLEPLAALPGTARGLPPAPPDAGMFIPGTPLGLPRRPSWNEPGGLTIPGRDIGLPGMGELPRGPASGPPSGAPAGRAADAGR